MTADIIEEAPLSWTNRHPVATVLLVFAGLFLVVVLIVRRKRPEILAHVEEILAPVSTIVPWSPLP